MTYLEYMTEHPEENLSWCRPYINDAEDSWMILCDGKVTEVHAPGIDGRSWDGTMQEALPRFARHLAGDDYDLYEGYTDDEIATNYLHCCGCASCPARHRCDAMTEQVEDGEDDA